MPSHQPAELDHKPLNFADIGRDLTAGTVVFLVALPLCLGVALASDAPLFSGVAAGIIGGLVVGALSGSKTSVAGPAAGLTAIVASQIAQLGSFRAFLLATSLAGVMQIALGLARAGSIAAFVPSSVIKGLLAAIGLILILKQIPHVFGHDPDPVGEMAFDQPDNQNTFSELLATIPDVHPGAALVGLLSLAVLVAWQRIGWLRRSLVPAPLAVVLLGLGVSASLSGSWSIGQEHLVQVPIAGSLSGAAALLEFPDLSQWLNPDVYTAAVTVALVASLETLLNLEAVDKLDPANRHSPPNRELLAQGAGNLLCGAVGALPVTSVIVRSSVNIHAGNKTRISTLFHGALLLGSVLFAPYVLNRIPLSCLAAILIVTGFKLASPKLVRQMWAAGLPQFLPFAITVGAIVLTDLLKGIVVGLIAALGFILRSNLKVPVRRIMEKHLNGEVLRIELSNQVSFLNKATLQSALDNVPEGGRVVLDATQTDYIDPDVLDLLEDFRNAEAPARGIQVGLVGLKEHYAWLDRGVQIADYATRELQDQLTPDGVLTLLREGNERFRRGERLNRDLVRQVGAKQDKESPLVVVLSCMESRVPVELVFDLGVGEALSVRVAGNVAKQKVIGSMEFGCAKAGAKLIVVLGHTQCEVIRAALVEPGPDEESSHMRTLTDEIRTSAQSLLDSTGGTKLHELEDDALARAHVVRTIGVIAEESPALRALVEAGRVAIVGGLYDVSTGTVEFFAGRRELSLAAPSVTPSAYAGGLPLP